MKIINRLKIKQHHQGLFYIVSPNGNILIEGLMKQQAVKYALEHTAFVSNKNNKNINDLINSF